MIEDGKFEILVEMIPPYSPDLTVLMERIVAMRELGVEAVSIVSNPMGKPKLPALFVASTIGGVMKRIVHYPCAGRSSTIFKSDMMAAVAMGIEGVLVLAGDPHDECSGQIRAADRIKLLQKPPFDALLVGAAASPQWPNLDNLQEKVDAGADFFETQPVFEVCTLHMFMEKTNSIAVPKIIGIMVPSRQKHLETLMEIPGVVIPESYIAQFAGVETNAEFSVIAVKAAMKLIEDCKECGAGGVYLSVAPGQLRYFEDLFSESD